MLMMMSVNDDTNILHSKGGVHSWFNGWQPRETEHYICDTFFNVYKIMITSLLLYLL